MENRQPTDRVSAPSHAVLRPRLLPIIIARCFPGSRAAVARSSYHAAVRCSCTVHLCSTRILLSLAYAVNSAQPLSGGIGSGMKSWQTTFKLVRWAVVYDV